MNKPTSEIIRAALRADATVTEDQRNRALAILGGKTDPTTPPLLLTAADVARLLSVSHQTIWRLRQAGDLTPVTLRGATRYKLQEINAILGDSKA